MSGPRHGPEVPGQQVEEGHEPRASQALPPPLETGVEDAGSVVVVTGTGGCWVVVVVVVVGVGVVVVPAGG